MTTIPKSKGFLCSCTNCRAEISEHFMTEFAVTTSDDVNFATIAIVAKVGHHTAVILSPEQRIELAKILLP